MDEIFIKIEGDNIFIRHNAIQPDRKSLLFVHGIGESGLCFREVFEDKRFDNFNIIVPDLTGYGRSSKAVSGEYSFESHIRKLWKILRIMGIQNNLIVVGHSMGGDLTTLLCASDKKAVITKYVNIEGDLTPADIFISNHAVEADEKSRFHIWFENEFKNGKVYEEWGKQMYSCRRYYASLCFCRAEAFLENAKEILKKSMIIQETGYNEISKAYIELSIPRMFCCGTQSISQQTLDFLKQNKLDFRCFEGASHWVMIDRSDFFYKFLFDFVSEE